MMVPQFESLTKKRARAMSSRLNSIYDDPIYETETRRAHCYWCSCLVCHHVIRAGLGGTKAREHVRRHHHHGGRGGTKK